MLKTLNRDDWETRLDGFIEQAADATDIESLPSLKEGIHVEGVQSWEDFLIWHGSLVDEYLFRGQRRAAWPLHSSIDRLFGVRESAIPFRNEPKLDPVAESKDTASEQAARVFSAIGAPSRYAPGGFGVSAESRMLFKFQQRAHEFLRHLPDKEDLVSWLALMQHHGAPTRLLDWTTSSYVAAFFALEDVTDIAAIWAVDRLWLDTCKVLMLPHFESGKKDTSQSDNLNQLLLKNYGTEGPYLVVEAEPARNDMRMTSQCGIFLVKCRTDVTFDESLTMMLIQAKRQMSNLPRPPIRKLEIVGSLRKDFLRNLRHVNIHQGTLFPGLDGFARSLRIDCELDHGWEAETRRAIYRSMV